MKGCLVVVLGMIFSVVTGKSSAMSKEEKGQMREKVLEMFNHAYSSYMRYAYPADELMPLTCKGRVRGVDPSRGDVDDALGRFSLTLIDTLDTLAVIGEVKEFEKAVKLVIRDVTFDSDVVVSVFETNIRVVGGLLGGHVAAVSLKNAGHGLSWYKGELLAMASDVGYRLLPAFNTSTGIPYPRVNLKYGIHHPDSNTGSEQDTCTACAGTMILEFGALSRLTGDPVFESKAHKAMEAIWMYRSRATDLVGTVINIHNGDWVRRDSGVGAGIDSYYEYCFKGYILLGDEVYLERFNKHYKSIMQYINQGPMFLSVQMHQPERTAHAYMDALQAFWPGLQVLKGDLHKAIETHQMLFEVAKKHTFLPEAFTTDFEVHWAQHPLRPELVESTYFLFEATGDPYYLEVGKTIIEKLNEHARVPCGFAAVKDVRTLSHEDRMDSFVLAETFKYLYLLFTDKEDLTLDIHKFLFTTEAHLLPLHLSTVSVNETATQQLRYNLTLNPENEHEYTCPHNRHKGGKTKFAEEIRRKARPKPQGSCPNKQSVPYQAKKSRLLRLRAEQFVPSNKKHLEILKTMGISVVQTKEGRIQLMHTASSAFTQEDAEDGIAFMQEMIELAKQRNEQDAIGHNPRVVQLMSSPYNGNIALNAGPAQFGLDLSKGDVGVGAEVARGEPATGCVPFTNQEELKHRIVILGRGECMFIDKVRQAEAAGAVGVVIIDDHEGSSSDQQPVFAMSGDGSSSDVKIPAVFLFHQEGQVLFRAFEAQEDVNKRLRIRLAAKASGSRDKKENTESGQGESKPNSGKTKTDPATAKTAEPYVENTNSKTSDSDSHPSRIAGKVGSLESINTDVDSLAKLEADGEDTADKLLHPVESKSDDGEQSVTESRQVVLGRDEVFCPGLGKPCPKESTLNPSQEAGETVKSNLKIKGEKRMVKKVYFDCKKHSREDFSSWSVSKVDSVTKEEDHLVSYTVIHDTIDQESSHPSVGGEHNNPKKNEGNSLRTGDQMTSQKGQGQDDRAQELGKEV